MAPVLSAGVSYCLPVSAALQPLLGPLGWIVTLAPGPLLPMRHKEDRDNPHNCSARMRIILKITQLLASPIVSICNVPAILAVFVRGW
jgi:hypothetical protein